MTAQYGSRLENLAAQGSVMAKGASRIGLVGAATGFGIGALNIATGNHGFLDVMDVSVGGLALYIAVFNPIGATTVAAMVTTYFICRMIYDFNVEINKPQKLYDR